MSNSAVVNLLAGFCIISVLMSCGSSDTAGGKDVFKTVYLTTNTSSLDVNADVAAHTDIATCGSPTDTVTIPAANSLNIAVTSNKKEHLGSSITLSNIHIRRIVVKYTPVKDNNTGVVGPPLTDRTYDNVDILIAPSTTVTIPVSVGVLEDKIYLYNDLACTGVIYLYSVQISMTAVEESSNESALIQGMGTNLRFADFVDQAT